MIEKFFKATVEAIQKEEDELNHLFSMNGHLYKNHHHGVCNLYETTFVYLIFKELLNGQFPLQVYWEYPYPGNSKEHCDLALLSESGELDSLIEFKIWTKEHDKEIKADALKLSRVSGCKKFIIVLGYGGDLNENHGYLVRDQILRVVNEKSMSTKYFKMDTGIVEDNNLNIFMCEVI